MTFTYEITGMGCIHCVDKVANALKAMPGVRNAEVSLEQGEAVVVMDEYIPENLVRAAVMGAGHYDAREKRIAEIDQ